MFNNISITGITKLDYYPYKCSEKNCKQNIKSIKICIPSEKPDMESINDIQASICIDDYKVVKTILGLKILVNLSCKIKVIYTALTEDQTVHSACWNINFCDFILIRNNYYSNIYNSDIKLFIGLEDVSVYNFDAKSINLSLLYIICNTLNHNKFSNNKRVSNCPSSQSRYTPQLYNKRNNCSTYYCPVNCYDTFDRN